MFWYTSCMYLRYMKIPFSYANIIINYIHFWTACSGHQQCSCIWSVSLLLVLTIIGSCMTYTDRHQLALHHSWCQWSQAFGHETNPCKVWIPCQWPYPKDCGTLQEMSERCRHWKEWYWWYFVGWWNDKNAKGTSLIFPVKFFHDFLPLQQAEAGFVKCTLYM